MARTLGAFEPSDKIDHQDETAALEVAHVTLGPKSQRDSSIKYNMGTRHQRVQGFANLHQSGYTEIVV